MSYLSNFLAFPSLLAGYAIAAKDLLLFGPLGKVYPAVTSDYAAVANIGAAAVAQSSVIAGVMRGRYALYRDTDGSIIVAAPNSGNNGLKLYKYSASGVALGTLVISSSAVQFGPVKMVKLTSGEFALSWFDNTTTLQYAIFNANMTLTLSAQNIEAAAGPSDKSDYYDMIALSGGGFALAWSQGSSTDNLRMIIRNNAGGSVFATATIANIPTANGGMPLSMVQLSSGDIAIAFNTAAGGTPIGLYHIIRSATGTSVMAATLINATSGTQVVPLIAATTGFYCIAYNNTVDIKASPYSNAGVAQGAPLSVTAGSTWTPGDYKSKLLFDGTNFQLVYPLPTVNTYGVSKIPTTGTGYVSTDTTLVSAATPIDSWIDAYSGLLVIVKVGPSTTNQVATFNLTSLLPVGAFTSFGTAATTNSGQNLAAIPAGGDFAFVAVYDYSTVAGTYLTVAKFADSAIAGVAVSGGAAGAVIPIAQSGGTYNINAIGGTSPKSFSHADSNVAGYRGTMQTNGVLIKAPGQLRQIN